MKSAIQIFLVVLLICALLVPGFGIASAQGSSSPTTLELQAGTYTVKLTFPGGEGKRTEMATFNRDPMVKVFVATQLNLEHVVTDVPIDVRIDVDGLPTDVWRLRVDYSDSLYTILKKYEDNTQSFKLLAQKGDSITDSSNRYDVRIDYKLSSGDWESAWVRFVLVLVEPTIEQKIGTISGRVALNDSKSRYPYGGVRNALVKLQLGGVTYTSYTNEGGFYSFDAQKLGVEFKEGDILTLTLCLQDGIDQGGIRRRYMTIVDVGASSAAVPVSIERVSQITETDFQLPVSEQNEPWAGMKQVDFIFEKAIIPVGYASRSNAALLPALVREYMAFEDAVDFALNKLGATITEVEVRVNDANACTNCMVSPVQYGDKAACYDSSPSPDNIIMGTGYTKPLPDTSSFERPTETEFHEFGHHIMGNQRLVTYPAPHVSHGGMLNPSTHDSLNEGEAEFLMLLIREFKGLYTFKSGDFIRSLPPGIVRGTNYEVNNKAWYQDRGVQQEDLAAASLLWDLYDASSKERLDDVFFPSANPVYDTLGIPLADLWEMLKKPEAMPLWNLYTMLNTKYPDRASDIDSVFIAHGFFRDKEEGNHTYDPPGTTNPAEEPDGVLIVDDEGILMTAWFTGEPFEDLNHDGIRQPAAERFVDLGRTNNYPGGPVYNARTDEVGSAGTYAISARQTWPPIIGSNIYIKDTEVDQVLIKVEFEPEYAYFTFEYVAPVESGLLYVTFPPAQYRTTMSVTPIVDGKLIDKSLQIEDT
ncbi:MAG: hypothetical protein FJZ95_08770, partial [Chloroflexi bacterium]|nr:hypothetical protein [Chloroflexota bacterium]